MTERTLGDEIVTIAEDVVSKIPDNIDCTVIKNYEDNNHVDIRLSDDTILKYIQVVGSNNIGEKGLLTFLNKDNNNPIVITGNNIINDENTILALGLGLFTIHDGDLYVELPSHIPNPFSINADGDLLIELPSGATNDYHVNDNGDLIYDRWDM